MGPAGSTGGKSCVKSHPMAPTRCQPRGRSRLASCTQQYQAQRVKHQVQQVEQIEEQKPLKLTAAENHRTCPQCRVN